MDASPLLDDFDYLLPPDLIARNPLPQRDQSRMLVLHCSAQKWEHRSFLDLPSYLQPGDLAVLNNSRVIRARIPTPDPGELFLAEPRPDGSWLCLVRPGKKWPHGVTRPIANTTATVLEVLPTGERLIRFSEPPDLERFGHVPLPPYLKRQPEPADTERYQTVFASAPGSVAAPTAGLHFTPEMLSRIPHAFVTLHVGLGTFAPLKDENLATGTLHQERYIIPPESARAINSATRILAVGTTVARVLESQPPGPLQPRQGRTSLFIRPPWDFQHLHMLLTNFHLPRSSLIMLVAALAGRSFTLAAYHEAVRKRYRFYSYGDCMLILP